MRQLYGERYGSALRSRQKSDLEGLVVKRKDETLLVRSVAYAVFPTAPLSARSPTSPHTQYDAARLSRSASSTMS